MKKDEVLRKAGAIGQGISFGLAGAVLANHFLEGFANRDNILGLFKLPPLNPSIITVLVVNLLVVVTDLHLIHFFGGCRSVFNLIRGHGKVVFYWALPADQSKEFLEQLREAEGSVRRDFFLMIPMVIMEEILYRAVLIIVWQDFGSTFGVFFLFLQAILFGAYHLDSGMQKASLIRYFIFAPTYALLWGIVSINSGSIVFAGIIHLFINSVGMGMDWLLYIIAIKRLDEHGNKVKEDLRGKDQTDTR
ncbi:MAG: CPBP family intramembrane metalloprotease [Candidatus Sungbacteria bacterium]|nr:CPBP family intramembrane metalloprotease [Candidatus Sungbacteria bacterium]